MGQRESKLSRRIMAALKQEGCFVFKVHGSEFMMSGLPDIVGVVDGLFFGFETKLPESRDNVSRRQAWVHEKIRRAGGVAEVVCSPTEALKIVRKMKGQTL